MLNKLALLVGLVLLIGACQTPNHTTTSPPTETTIADTIVAALPVYHLEDALNLTYVTGKFDPENHVDFVKIPKKYADKEGRYMRKDAFDRFKAMYEAAQEAGINLVIKSAARNFNYQKGIWERKWMGKTLLEGKIDAMGIKSPKDRALAILRYSSMPSTSRHHWGTDIDLNAFENDYFKSGEGAKVYDWLVANAATYGYGQPYTPKGDARPHGYYEERWHWSYLPVAKELLKVAQKDYSDDQISGFLGAETAREIGVVEKYILGINPELKQ